MYRDKIVYIIFSLLIASIIINIFLYNDINKIEKENERKILAETDRDVLLLNSLIGTLHDSLKGYTETPQDNRSFYINGVQRSFQSVSLTTVHTSDLIDDNYLGMENELSKHLSELFKLLRINQDAVKDKDVLDLVDVLLIYSDNINIHFSKEHDSQENQLLIKNIMSSLDSSIEDILDKGSLSPGQPVPVN